MSGDQISLAFTITINFNPGDSNPVNITPVNPTPGDMLALPAPKVITVPSSSNNLKYKQYTDIPCVSDLRTRLRALDG